MTAGALPTPELLRQLLAYDPGTGALTWRERGPEMCIARNGPSEKLSRHWNQQFAGKPAFTAFHRTGYHHGRVAQSTQLAHRVIWAIVHGQWPENHIDHINGDRSDNRLANLRHVTRVVNGQNKKRHSNNKSGTMGVFWSSADRKWRADIRVLGARKYLGVFDHIEDAVAARKAAEERYGFHENHGRAGNGTY